jgi:hypothetical protein
MAKASDAAKSTKDEEKTLFLGEPAVELTEDEIENLANQDDSFDIFIDVGEKLYKEGDRVLYTVRKDGAFLAGSIKHPFSWDQIHRKYGGGTYQVNARSSRAGKFVKSESRFLADIAVDDDDRPREEMRSSSGSAVELLALLQQSKKEDMEEARRREERIERDRKEERERLERENKERMEAQKSEQSSTMQLMMQMMQQSNAQTTALLTALVGGKKEDVSIEKVLTLMDTRMEKMIERIVPKEKKSDLSYKDLLDAEDRGYKKAMDMHSLADKKAEDLADLREAGGAQKDNSESTVVKVIENLMPAVQGLMAARMAMPTASPQAPLHPGVNPHRPALPAPPTAGAKVAPKPPTAASAPARGPLNAATVLGVNKPAPRVEPRKAIEPMESRELIERTVFQEMGVDLSTNFMFPSKLNPEGVAEKCLQILKPFGISAKTLCSQYTLDDMINVAKGKGIPDAIRPYLERFHAHIQAQTPVDAGSDPASSQPTNP